MRAGSITNIVNPCQPLRFGKLQDSQSKSSADYEKEIAILQKKYELACHIAAAQANQYDSFVKAGEKS